MLFTAFHSWERVWRIKDSSSTYQHRLDTMLFGLPWCSLGTRNDVLLIVISPWCKRDRYFRGQIVYDLLTFTIRRLRIWTQRTIMVQNNSLFYFWGASPANFDDVPIINVLLEVPPNAALKIGGILLWLQKYVVHALLLLHCCNHHRYQISWKLAWDLQTSTSRSTMFLPNSSCGFECGSCPRSFPQSWFEWCLSWVPRCVPRDLAKQTMGSTIVESLTMTLTLIPRQISCCWCCPTRSSMLYDELYLLLIKCVSYRCFTKLYLYDL